MKSKPQNPKTGKGKSKEKKDKNEDNPEKPQGTYQGHQEHMRTEVRVTGVGGIRLRGRTGTKEGNNTGNTGEQEVETTEMNKIQLTKNLNH